MIKEFKEFMLQGNVLDLAVGIVIGGVFTNIVTSLVEGVITPLVTLVIKLITGGDGSIEGFLVNINGVTFDFNRVISAIITFIITALVVFLIVKSINRLRRKQMNSETTEEESNLSDQYLKEIRDLLQKK